MYGYRGYWIVKDQWTRKWRIEKGGEVITENVQSLEHGYQIIDEWMRAK